MTSKSVSSVLTLLLAFLMLPGAALAQVETGQIAGTVTDPQGAVISGASVTVSGKDTGVTRSVKTTGDGTYNITNLQPGTYEVKVEGAGFGTKTVPAQVSVGTRTTVDTTLDVGGSVASVDVIAGEQGIQVNTENQTLQTVVSEKEIRELPTSPATPTASSRCRATSRRRTPRVAARASRSTASARRAPMCCSTAPTTTTSSSLRSARTCRSTRCRSSRS